MMLSKLFTILATIMLITTTLQGSDLIPIWNQSLEDTIQDIELLPNGKEFMITTSDGEIQIRNTDNGELIRTHVDNSNQFMNGYFEITPDSTRAVMCISGLLQLINLEDFERLNFFTFEDDTIAKGFKDIALDPIKPYAYVIVTGREKTSGNNELRSKISIYNYETMKLVEDLTDYNSYEYTAIAVSDDGKYLATLNNGKAYLKVWDLANMELIRIEQLWDGESSNADWWCISKDIQFSKINSDDVYYSGFFTNQIKDKRKNGVFKFNIFSSYRSRVVEDGQYDEGKIALFDNEKRLLISDTSSIYVLNLENNELEYSNELNTLINVGGKVIYSNINNSFIGFSGIFIDEFIYDFQTNVNTDQSTVKNTISPNPTTGNVNISFNNKYLSFFRYDVINDSGQVILSNDIGFLQPTNNNLNINISSFPTRHYLIRVNSEMEEFTFNIIKE